MVGAPGHVIWIITASRMTLIFTSWAAISAPAVAILPTLRLVLVKKREWSWLESSFMAVSREPVCIRLM